ncbi:MAG: TMEM198/TM7SF3 family protein [Caldilineales bacterium]|nr:TMEM198/TM7SF3 family protein [Caldilineales bacterium]MDW8316374.1 DUF4203 domain-containing protein [Anaerolineae bacterium]
MPSDNFLSVMCFALLALVYGLGLTFFGYRLFLFLLPIWGFVFGFVFGAQALQALLGEGFLVSVTSWIVGFFVGAVFAILSYLFYFFAVGVVAGSLGYSLTTGFFTGLLNMRMNLLVWLIAVLVAAVVIFITYRFNLQKYVVIVATAVLGAGSIVATLAWVFRPSQEAVERPVRAILDAGPLLTVLAAVLIVAGVLVQLRANRYYTVEEYNNWDAWSRPA